MTRHPLDPTALIAGLLFLLSGLAIVIDQSWPRVDTTAVVGATVGVLGLFFVVNLVRQQLRAGSAGTAPGDSES